MVCKKVKILVQICLVLILFFSLNAFAQHEETEQAGTHDSVSTGHDHHFHPNHIAIFTGATTKLEGKNDTDFTLGADYVRRFSKSGLLGIGIFGEAIFADHTEWLFGIPLYLYPLHNFWLRAGPAIEIHEKKKKSESAMSGKSKTETDVEFVLRTGLGYDIEVGGFTIAPNLSFDFLRSKTSMVWGLNFGKGF